ncbi:MAG TPA: hypothetical protein DD377_06575 [Firmicutes bacterium]|nr:hypothetical protein [Bacillota bacterium]
MEIQSGHDDVFGECEFLLPVIIVYDVEDIRGGEVVDGSALFQIRVDVVRENPREVMCGVFGQFLLHVVSPPFRRSGSRVSRFQNPDG